MFDLYWRGWFFKNDGGAGDSKTDDGAADTDDVSKDTSKDVKAGDDLEKAKEKKEEKTFTQVEVDEIVKERLARAKKKADDEADKAKKKADEEALEKNQEFQKLAETRQTKITELESQMAELEPFKEQADKYKAALEKQLKAMQEKLPKHILPLLAKMDPIDAMDYITKNAKDLGVSVSTYSETPDGKDKTLTDDQKSEGKKAQTSLIGKNF